MADIDQQLHGYRQGHQLLSSTLKLDSHDQELVDRLSDVAGPLRPGEQFAPYLTGYPLPSRSHYVLARTWQDLEVRRAGCVRTVSLFIKTADWESAATLLPWLSAIDAASIPSSRAERLLDVSADDPVALPVPVGFYGAELIEALFLEERKPIAVFEAPGPELVAIRLLTALWPSFRSRFAVSTFALSPRRLSGRSFDLVFAPKDARPRFSDWDGRRIDGGSTNVVARHPWTEAIVESIFLRDSPELLSGAGRGLLDADDTGSEKALRIALLWSELYQKLDTTPTAILGLLDIANTRETRDIAAIRTLEPALAHAAFQATTTLHTAAAWSFIEALTRKLRDINVTQASANAIRSAVVQLTVNDPVYAIGLFAESESPPPEELIGAVADGLSRSLTDDVILSLASLPAHIFVQLLVSSSLLAQTAILESTDLFESLLGALPHIEGALLEKARHKLLPLLVEERHVSAAALMIRGLGTADLIEETRHLYAANRLAVEQFIPLIAGQVRNIDSQAEVRDAVAVLGDDKGVDDLLAAIMRCSAENAAWITNATLLDDRRRATLLLRLLRPASPTELRATLSDPQLTERVLMQIPVAVESTEVLQRIVEEVPIPVGVLIATVLRVLAVVRGHHATRLASLALEKCLPERFPGDEIATIDTLLGVVGENLNGAWLIRIGMGRHVDAAIASRNVIAFERASPPAQIRLLEAIEELARTILARNVLDLSAQGVSACADMFLNADTVNARATLRASLELLPFLLKATQRPASSLIAAVFPIVYRELRRGADVPDILRLFLFIDWDRCKVARRELVSAAMASNWKPSDIALAAARAEDALRIIRRISRSEKADSFMSAIEQDLNSIPSPWRDKVSSALQEVRRGEATPIDE